MEPTGVEMQITQACEHDYISSTTAIELMRLAGLFEDFGWPRFYVKNHTAYMTWTIAHIETTISMGDCGYWGFFMCHPDVKSGDMVSVYFGSMNEKASRIEFRELCMMAKAYMLEILVLVCEQLNKLRGSK